MKLISPSRLLPFISLLAGSACFLSAGMADLQAQDQSVSGNLGVTGALDVYGDTINFGSWANDATRFGLNLAYGEDTGHHATLTLTTTRPASAWLWRQAAPGNSAGSVPQMSLSAGDALTLYDQATPTPNAAIVLDPVGGSTFKTSVTMNGADNQMPNQTFTGTNSVLTVGLADARYLAGNAGTGLSLGNSSSATAIYSTAVGYTSNASGFAASAFGPYTTSSGFGSTAVGSSAGATSTFAVALGNLSLASGSYSLALGQDTIAEGDASVAVSVGAHASGAQASAFGEGSLASGYAAMSLGAQSIASGYAASTLGASSQATNSYSLALGHFSVSSGVESATLGENSLASADQAVSVGAASAATGAASESIGYHSAATGASSMALGSYSQATGSCATALGNSSVAGGDFSVAAGVGHASSAYECSVGAYGVSTGNAQAWVATDALFTIGNGQSSVAPSNAFQVKKNGDTMVGGNLTVVNAIIIQPQGDLSMGAFTAQPSPTP